MQLHQIKNKSSKKKKRKVGRGGKRGSYSGKGIKGQKSRAGRKMRPELRDIIKKLPKKRGYRFKTIQKTGVEVLNVGLLEKKFEHGSKIDPKILHEKGLIRKNGKFLPEVKLLGSGTLTKKLLVSECQISESAKKKIIDVGGEIINPSI